MYSTARALRSFLRDENSDEAYAGALRVSETLDDIRVIRKICEAWYNGQPKH